MTSLEKQTARGQEGTGSQPAGGCSGEPCRAGSSRERGLDCTGGTEKGKSRKGKGKSLLLGVRTRRLYSELIS